MAQGLVVGSGCAQARVEHSVHTRCVWPGGVAYKIAEGKANCAHHLINTSRVHLQVHGYGVRSVLARAADVLGSLGKA